MVQLQKYKIFYIRQNFLKKNNDEGGGGWKVWEIKKIEGDKGR
jgi:hypothetical protein